MVYRDVRVVHIKTYGLNDHFQLQFSELERESKVALL